jgi:cytochrome b involved in lipid metabolism
MNEEGRKFSKLTLTLLFLIALSLAYLVYASNRSNKVDVVDTNTIDTPINDQQEKLNTSPTAENADASATNTYTKDQVALKNKATDCWTIINGNVYDITSYVPNHPGGEEEIVKVCGKDGSQLFAKPMEHKEGGAENVLSGFKIGTLKQ